MRVCVVTGSPFGGAAAALSEIAAAQGVELACVILSDNSAVRRSRTKMFRKIARIGLLGALNGVRMRQWYRHHNGRDLRAECERLGIPLVTVPTVNGAECIETLKEYRIDLGISLGNGYIASRVFSVPPEGFINYHGELLPAYPGAQSIIWPIYDEQTQTGFTLHCIDRGIDTGAILEQRRFDIVFRENLRETIAATAAVVHPELPRTLRLLLEEWPTRRAAAVPQGPPTRHFTTPTFWQFLRMARNNRKFYRLHGGAQNAPPPRSS